MGALSTPQHAASEVRAKARCFDPDSSNTFLFFSDDPMNLARAKAICAKCTVRQACLTTALRRQEAYGIWGGELLIDGEIKADVPRRGRPRKVARILVNVDEITGTPIVA